MSNTPQPVRLKAVLHVEWEYYAHPDDYGTSDPREMAKIDLENFEADPYTFFPELGSKGITALVTVDPA